MISFPKLLQVWGRLILGVYQLNLFGSTVFNGKIKKLSRELRQSTRISFSNPRKFVKFAAEVFQPCCAITPETGEPLIFTSPSKFLTQRRQGAEKVSEELALSTQRGQKLKS
jgi:hypothetical protein